MGVDREVRGWGVFVSLYGSGTSNGCHMAKENGEKWRGGSRELAMLQTCAEFIDNRQEMKRNRIKFI